MGGRVASEVRLAVTLRYLAGSMVDDLALIYHISKNEVYKSLWATIDAMNKHPDFKIQFPLGDVEALKKLELEFALAHERRYGSLSWRGQVSAVDGVDFSIRNPGKAVKNPRRFFVERKGHYVSCASPRATRTAASRTTTSLSRPGRTTPWLGAAACSGRKCKRVGCQALSFLTATTPSPAPTT